MLLLLPFRLSETCDEDAPHVITHVETKPSTTKDHEVTDNVHQTLANQELLPQQHLVDAGYIDAPATCHF
ncbi:MAG: hypothetical protein QNJ65_18325 [Xenococcaceae cyanobacterium MO_234.B1]|nr:hypothetical protein [Xenococcaceae cyanobacterium MO_234.B1]